MFSDAYKAIRAGLRVMVHEFKYRRWLRRYHQQMETL